MKTKPKNSAFISGLLLSSLLATTTAQAEQIYYSADPIPANEMANLLFPEQRRGPPMRGLSTFSTLERPAQRYIEFTPSWQQAGRSDPVPRKLAKTSRSAGNKVKFAHQIHFSFDSDQVLTRSRPHLDEIAAMLKLDRTRGRSIMIEGHADASGGFSYNQGLSERRAEAIKGYLVQHHQIDSRRLIAVGKGETEPLDSADPYHAINRRAQFYAAD